MSRAVVEKVKLKYIGPLNWGVDSSRTTESVLFQSDAQREVEVSKPFAEDLLKFHGDRFQAPGTNGKTHATTPTRGTTPKMTPAVKGKAPSLPKAPKAPAGPKRTT